MRWPWRHRADEELAEIAERTRCAERERDEVRRQTPQVRRLTDRLAEHLEQNQFAERLYQQMIETRR